MGCCLYRRPEHSYLLKFIYHSDSRVKPLAEKFYARHECIDSKSDLSTTLTEHEDLIKKMLAHDPRDDNAAPVTENQVYGWIDKYILKHQRDENRKLEHHPLKVDETFETIRKIRCDIAEKRRQDHLAEIDDANRMQSRRTHKMIDNRNASRNIIRNVSRQKSKR